MEELTEGLKETMLLFKEREESFDSLAAINREQEKKVSWRGKKVGNLGLEFNLHSTFR